MGAEAKWKEPKAHTKETENTLRKDRKSSTGTIGNPKKGGHGGKFTWAGDHRRLPDGSDGGAMDRGDPNFEDPEDDEEDKRQEK